MLTYTVPLGNFDRQSQLASNLGDARIIASKKLPRKLFEYILDSFEKRRELVDINPPKFYLQMNLADETLKNDETTRRPLDRTLVIFKLFKDGLVKSNIIFVQHKGTINNFLWRHYVRWTHPETPVPAYLLKRTEESSFRKFWREFASIDTSNFAVHRFHLADFRPYLRDRFTDYVESLEYLLVPDSGEGEIAYKFRTRGALTLSTPRKRVQVYENLDDAYNLRSAVVHGAGERESKILSKKGATEIEGWEEMIRLTRTYDRQLITLFFREKCYDNRDVRRKYLVQKSMCIS